VTDRRWQHPLLRIVRLIRAIVGTRWDQAAWPTAKETLKLLEQRM